MAYSELIKTFSRIRDYMRQFYVYGFRSRTEYSQKSARSYDNERRRIESWMGEYMSFRRDENGKAVFLSVDSRAIPANPLYHGFKAKSFTAGDIAFHFYVMDLLSDGQARSLREIGDAFAGRYLSGFHGAEPPDESGIRRKLKEYTGLGLLTAGRRGRETVYRRTEDHVDEASWLDAAAFFSEADPLGVIGSYLLDRAGNVPDLFRFKHHYILHALDSQILCDLLLVIDERRAAELTVQSPRNTRGERTHTVFPMKIFVSTQSGRQYLLCHHYRRREPVFFRLDSIRSVKAGEAEKDAERYLACWPKFRGNLWGVSTGAGHSVDHIEMTLHVEPDEGYILERLEREKRNGTVEVLDSSTVRFTADVYDAAEMLPWLRTFIGRIVRLECSDPSVTDTFYADLAEMEQSI